MASPSIMANFDVNCALLAYLGGARDGRGIQPATMQKRLAEFAGRSLHEIQPIMDGYLERTINLSIGDLPESPTDVTEQVAFRLAEQMPELSDLVHLKLATYYTYIHR